MTASTASTGPNIPLSVVIPCYEEEDNIVPLIEEIGRALDDGADYEIIVVDDCSSDRTVARLTAALELGRLPLRVVVHGVNKGQSAAICSGVEAARGEWIATLDGDGQNDPADIPALLAAQARGGHDMICGHRTERRDTAVRRLSSRIANGVRGLMLGDETPDTGCGLKLFRRDLFMGLPRFNHMHRFLPALTRRAGGRIVSVPVNHRTRRSGRSKYGIGNRLWVGIVDIFGVMWLARRAFRQAEDREIHG